MKVLHLFSNAKWTGPAEPALNLCVALRELGVEADLAFPDVADGRPHTFLDTARDKGIEPILRFRLSKHYNPVINTLDSWALNGFLKKNPYDLIHCHLDNGHRIALGPARRNRIPLVRSSYDGAGLRKTKLHARLLKETKYLIEPSKIALDFDHETYKYPLGSMKVIPGGIDVIRFDPRRETPDGRRRLGIPPDAFVVGIVARMQTHRRYEDFFQAVRMLLDASNNVHAIVVGRGTRQESVGKGPVRDLNLQDRVHFSGYVAGDDYVGMLNAFNVKVFLVPGSDGTCRAVREAMAMGKPILAADRGMLREIVTHEKTGFVCDGSPAELYRYMEALCRDRQMERNMGRAARQHAVGEFSLEVQAKAVRALYETVVAGLQA